ncbi:MAG: helix-turn-helix domain-containing protein [Rhodoferax sp.]|nr:helix-turn-helix domain-containing protein [Rhodoferax sp.]
MTPIQIAITHAGNATRLAKALGVTTQAICFWRDDQRVIPAERCLQIERITNGLFAV